MKNSIRFIILGAIFGLSLPAFLMVGKANEAHGYSISSLPTTIDLNDTSAANIRSYYSSLNSLAQNQRQGTNLLKNLKTILKNGQKYYSYDSGNAIWQIYEISDRDWAKSPASSTTYGTYNSSTNTITGYTYGTSTSNGKNNPYIHALYINRNVTNETRAWDDHQQTEWGINREHVWPKAEGFEGSGAGGARGDPMHLMAGNGYSNNIHSNYYYGYVNTDSSYTNCGTKYSNQNGNLLGKSKTKGGTTNVFEPQDCDKGDIARAIFYMVARYNYLSGSDSDGIDCDNPNLALTSSLSDWSSSSYLSTTTNTGKMGIMEDLLAWHHADPVDEYEIHRNNLLYTNYTNNRNPFIDFPEWADFIWGTVTYNGSTYQSYNSTPTGYATPNSDTINGYNSSAGVSISDTSINIETGSSAQISATSSDSSAITWTTSNSNVASISSSSSSSGSAITITGVSVGSATITAKATISGTQYSKTCTVNISAPKTLSSISVSGQTTSFTKGDTFVFGGTVTAHYSDSSTADVTASATFSGYDMSTTGSQTVTVSYGGKSTTYQISVSEASSGVDATMNNGTNSSAATVNSKTAIKVGTSGNSGNMTITVPSGATKLSFYSAAWKGSTDASLSLSCSGVTINPSSVAIDADNGITSNSPFTLSGNEADFYHEVSLSGVSSQKDITITSATTNRFVIWGAKYYTSSAPTLSSISLNTSNVQTIFDVDETFSYSGLVVTAHYSDSSSQTVTPTSVSSPDMSTIGEKTVTVTYNDKTASYTISVIEPDIPVSGVSLDKNSATLSVGGTTQLTATVSPNDATNKDVSWSSSDDTIAEVSTTGLVTANKAGSATITVTTDDGEYQATCSITVQNASGTIVDELTYENTSESSSSYTSWTYTSSISSATYAGNSATNNGKNIQIRNNTTTNSGIVSTVSGGTLCEVTIIWATDIGSGSNTGKTITIYGKNTAYTAVSNLYSESTRGTELGTSTYSSTNLTQRITISGSYSYVGILASGASYLSSIEISYVASGPITSISASVNKTYHPGETILASDVTVTGNTGANVTSFTLVNAGYQFTYNDAPSGGSIGNKQFTVRATLENTELTCTLTVNVSRNAYASPSTSTLTHTGAEFKTAGIVSSYTTNQTATVDGITFTVDGYIYSNTKLSLSNGKTSAPGKVINTTPYPQGIVNVSISGASPDVQLSTDGSTWVDLADATPDTVNYLYLKIYYKTTTQSSYININQIDVEIKGSETAINVANYVMYEDTANQCTTKFDVAKRYFENMSTSEKSTFMTSNDFVIAKGRERLEAWATYLGKEIVAENGSYVIKTIHPISNIIGSDSTNNLALIVIISVFGIGIFGGCFYFRKKKYE